MIGSDPQIVVRFPFILRPRFIVVELASLGQFLRPNLYMPQFGRFDEDRSKLLSAAKSFLIVVNIGKASIERKFRIDPAEEAGQITTRLTKFSTIEDVERHIARFKETNETCVVEVVQLSRFSLFSVRAIFEKWYPQARLSRRLNRVYSLGAKAQHTLPEPTSDEIWLSLVVPVYNAPKAHLDGLLKSFRSQQLPGAELVLSDDASQSQETRTWLQGIIDKQNVKVVWNEKNQSISAATNAGIHAASGKWIAFIDHNDVIAPHALKLIRNALLENPQTKFLYTDEVVVSEDLKPQLHMAKPAFDPVLLSGMNYINHFSVYQRGRLVERGLLDSDYDGSQGYELLLRYLNGLEDCEVLHLPYPAYWRRNTKGNCSRMLLEKATQNARKGLSKSYEADVVAGLHKDLHRVNFPARDEDLPVISIIIPSRNSYPLIKRVLSDLYEKTDYPNFEVIVVDNGTSDADVLSLYKSLEDRHPNFTASVQEEHFNFSRSVNRGFSLAKGEHYLLLNNDVEVIEEDWLKEMVSCLNYPDAGIVGAKLLYPNNTIQHAGVIVGASGLAGHWYYKKPAGFEDPMKRLLVRNGMTCVTGAVMLISGACREKVGDFDEEHFAIAYNDVDYCIRAYKAGFRSVWTPFSSLYHHESVSRGSDKSVKNQIRFRKEKQNLRRIHSTFKFNDPATNQLELGSRSRKFSFRRPLNLLPRHWFVC